MTRTPSARLAARWPRHGRSIRAASPASRATLMALLLMGFLGACGNEEIPIAQGRTMGAAPPPAKMPAVAPSVAGSSRERGADGGSSHENQVPVLVGIVIEPFGDVTVRNDIVAKPRAKDIDGDTIEFSYSWRINGANTFVDGATLSKAKFHRGDWINLTVVASDGRASSEPLESKPFEVTNAAPVITSQPGGFDASGTLRYQVQIEDPDDDRGFTYQLLEGPDGMQIDAQTGLLDWRPTKQQTGSHTVKIEVVDRRGGKAWQTFDLAMDLVSGVTAAPAAIAPN